MFTEGTGASTYLKHSRDRWRSWLDFLQFQVGSESKIHSFVTFEFLILAQGCLKYTEGDKVETPNQEEYKRRKGWGREGFQAKVVFKLKVARQRG